MPSIKIRFENHFGLSLSAKLEMPLLPKPIGYAIFAHVFTGTKNLKASRIVTRALQMEGFGVFRFDFTGLGESEGDFSETNFTSNVLDLMAAAAYLEKHYKAPSLIVGHSLGGSASIFAGAQIPSIKAIATIGSPFDPKHVTHLLHGKLAEIIEKGEANVEIQGRHFNIKKQFIEDLYQKDMLKILEQMNKAFLVLHSPQDGVVEIENARNLYQAANHPKSFVSLTGADHMLTNKDDAFYAGEIIANWAKRYIPRSADTPLNKEHKIAVRTSKNALTTEVLAGNHSLLADQSEALGGYDFGPSPYELLTASFGASTAMTIQRAAEQEQLPIVDIQVHIGFENTYFEDIEIMPNNKIFNRVTRSIDITGDFARLNLDRIISIADHCPIFKILSKSITIETDVEIRPSQS